MKLQEVSLALFDQLATVTQQLTPAEFTRPLPVLLGSSIGKHLRHVMEFFDLTLQAHQTGHLNYDHRIRQTYLETDPRAALDALLQLGIRVKACQQDRLLNLQASYAIDGFPDVCLSTTYFRELHYNIEHAIHHSAIIRIGLEATFSDVVLPAHFGLAHATVRHETKHQQHHAALLTQTHLDHVQLHE